MRRAFAACIGFAVLIVIAVVRFGFKDSPRDAPAQRSVDAAIATTPIDAGIVVLDAAPTPKRHVAKPTPRPTATRPTPKPAPGSSSWGIPTLVIPAPVRGCTQPPNPAGCPATEPNINRPCDADGVHCVYGRSCCPFVYVCNNGAFEAWFTHCP